MAQFQLGPEQVPEDLIWLYELVGMDYFLQIIDTAGGDFVYVPKRATLERNLRRAAIIKEFNGSNVQQLSRKYGLSDRHIRTIIQEEGLRKSS